MRFVIFSTMLLGILGCSREVQLKGTPVSVSGNVSQSGQPLGGVMMVFQPLGDGHVRELPVQSDGSFTGEMISGEYAYYVARPVVAAALPAVKNVPASCFEPDLSRTVNVQSGQQLAIELQ